MNSSNPIRFRRMVFVTLGIAAMVFFANALPAAAQNCTPSNTKTANVVALDQPFFWNRLGTVQPQGMIFALKGDVINKSGNPADPLIAGQVMLKETKRPRPIVLRMNVGDCLTINFTNLLNPVKVDEEQPATRYASVRALGMQLVGNINMDGSFVGQNQPVDDPLGRVGAIRGCGGRAHGVIDAVFPGGGPQPIDRPAPCDGQEPTEEAAAARVEP